MGNGLRARLTFSNVVSVVALFVALATGGAYAANTVFSSDIVDGQVKTADLADGAVLTAKLADGSVTSEKVKDATLRSRDVLDNALSGADIDESTLSSIGGGGGAGGDLTGRYPNPQIAGGAVGSAEVQTDALTGDDVLESSFDQVPTARQAGTGYWDHDGTCDPVNGEGLLTCASRTVALQSPGSILVIGRVRAYNNNAGEAAGNCYVGVGNNPNAGIYTDTLTQISLKNIFTEHAEVMAVIKLSEPGDYPVEIRCSEFIGNFSILEAELVAVPLAG